METVNQPVVVEEKEYRYQPKDEQGRPIGGEQVIKYKTQDELLDKITKNHEQAIRQLRKVTRDNRLGIQPNENLPEDAERLGDLVELKPRSLSSEERFEISQQLNDPEKFDTARDRLLESALGVPVVEFAAKFNAQQILTMQLAARDNYLLFAQTTQGYTDCPENRETMTDWMWKNRLAPTVKNFVLASQQLKEAGLLLSAPASAAGSTPAPVTPSSASVPVETEPNPQAPVVPTPRIEGGEVAATPAGPYASLTLRDINKMPVEEYRQKLNDPEFVELVNKLEREAHGQPPAQPQAKRAVPVPSGLNERVSSASNGSSATAASGNSLTLREINLMSPDEYARRMRDPKFCELVNKLEAEAAARRRQLGIR